MSQLTEAREAECRWSERVLKCAEKAVDAVSAAEPLTDTLVGW